MPLRDYVTITYLIIILFCVTLSQKFPKFPQEWPFLYFGIAMIGFATLLMVLNLITRGTIKISGGMSFLIYVIFPLLNDKKMQFTHILWYQIRQLNL